MKKNVLVLGASLKPFRYSNMAVRALVSAKHDVVAIGKRTGEAAKIIIQTSIEDITDVDTISVYMNAANQKEFYDLIFTLLPKRIIFNPGAENPELHNIAKSKGIEVVEGCTLMMLSNGDF